MHIASLNFAEVLKPENIREVLDISWDYRSKWKFIGIELKIPDSTLEAIETDHKKCEDCLLDMIKIWLRGDYPQPTRSAITAALQSKYVADEVTSIQGG